MNDTELAEIRQRAEQATPGPWSMKQDGADFYMADSQGRYLDITLADAIFASHSRQDIPALLDEVERLQQRLGECEASLIVMDKLTADNARLRAALDDMLLLIAEHGTKIMWSHKDRITAARNALKGDAE